MRQPLPRTGIGLLSSQEAWSQALSRVTNSEGRLLRISPNRILALRLRSKNQHQKNTYRGPFYFGASLRSGRLPILTFQTMLTRQDLSSEKRLAACIAERTPAEWKDVFNSLAGRGWSKEQLDHWVWIVSADDGDGRVQRLLSTEEPKPIFLLLLLLRRDEVYRQPESLTSLMEYAAKHHIAHEPAPIGTPRADTAILRRKILTVTQFCILIRRLVFHFQRVRPRSVGMVAHFAAEYIKSIPNDPHHHRHNTDYHDQCFAYNTTLTCLKSPAPNEPIVNMEFNWRAQRVLLALSDGLDKPLIINRNSYRAIRRVLLGLRKSQNEKVVALRYAKSWPPYRQDFDGLDAKRTAEDDMSRSMKAGVLMKEAGYPAEEYDHALDALGGMTEDSPTIHTRSLSPKEWTGDQVGENIFSSWAMSVRATRNSQEAWRAFNRFAATTGRDPNFQVYSEMFLKIQEEEGDPGSRSEVLPGDARETFPVHDANYTEYELARLAPPTVAELYAEMISRGVKPWGYGLHRLVSRASSIEEGLRYMQDGGIPEDVTKAISLFKQPSHSAIRKIPLLLYNAYINLLCRLQPNRQGQEKLSSEELYRIRHAIKLVNLRLTPDSTAGVTFRPPWYSILRALGRYHLAIQNGSAAMNDLVALNMSMETLESAQACIGIDAELFLLFCRIVQKAAHSRLNSLSGIEFSNAPLIPHSQDLLHKTTSMFSQLTTPLVDGMPGSLPVSNFHYPLGPPHLHTYMRALAFFEARDEMIHLVIWMLDHYEHIEEESHRLGHRGPTMVAKTFCAFHAFAGPLLEEEILQDLDNRMNHLIANGGQWHWPTSEEVDDYIRADIRGGSARLQRRVRARADKRILPDYQEHLGAAIV